MRRPELLFSLQDRILVPVFFSRKSMLTIFYMWPELWDQGIIQWIHSSKVEQHSKHLRHKQLHLIFKDSVQFSRSVVSNSLWPHELQHARPPCPCPTPGVYSNSCALSWWCHPAISSSVVPFSSCPQSLPASGAFPTSQIFAWGGQSTGVSASASVLPMNTQDWSPSGWTGWISLQSTGLPRVFSGGVNVIVESPKRKEHLKKGLGRGLPF